MPQPPAPPDAGAQAWARQIDVSPHAAITATVDGDTVELLIASASEAGLTTMMLILTRTQAYQLAAGLLGAVYENVDSESRQEVERDLDGLDQP